jgi:hypothetical protein
MFRLTFYLTIKIYNYLFLGRILQWDCNNIILYRLENKSNKEASQLLKIEGHVSETTHNRTIRPNYCSYTPQV